MISTAFASLAGGVPASSQTRTSFPPICTASVHIAFSGYEKGRLDRSGRPLCSNEKA